MQKLISLIKEKGLVFLVSKLAWKVDELSKSTYRKMKYSFLPTQQFNQVSPDFLNWDVFDGIRLYERMQNEKILFHICDRILLNKFDILGHYEIDCSNADFDNAKCSIEQYIRANISAPNQEFSLKIASHLNENHILIDWQKDFSSGYKWNIRQFSKNIKFGHIDGVDIKYPWEFGRMQFLPWLAMASLYSGDKKYIIKADNILIDFIAQNPPYFGVQWKTTMDIAIRAVNICLYIVLKKDFLGDISSVDNQIINCLNSHLYYIRENLEWSGGMRANHYFTGICGLLILCSFLGINAKRLEIFRFALDQLANEILYQFNEDGSNFEASLPYHFFVSNMLFTTLDSLQNISKEDLEYLSKKLPNSEKYRVGSKLIFSHEVEKRISAIVDFNYNVPTISGKIPTIGDDDSGFFLRIIPPFVLEKARIIKKLEYDFNFHYPQSRRELLQFPDFGIYIFNKPLYSFYFRCGSLGQKGKGGHAHNDQLSFCLFVKDFEIFVDPGTYNYTGFPELRNKFRSTSYHNCLQIKNKEQNPIPRGRAGDLFWLPERTFAKVDDISPERITASHGGYVKPTIRSIEFNHSTIDCTDSINSTDEKLIHFHLHPKVSLKIVNHNEVILNSHDIKIFLMSDDGEFFADTYEFAPEYGKKVISNKIVLIPTKNVVKWQIKINETN